MCVRCCGSRSPSLASPLLSSGEGEAGEARPRWTAQWLGRPTKEEGGPRATDRLVPPFARPPMPSLPEPAPAFSLLPSFWALPSFSLPLQGPSDLRLCPSVRWSFPTCSAIQAVPPLSVVPAGGPALALVPFLSPSKSQIKGKEWKAEEERKPNGTRTASLRWAARGSELGWQSRGRRARVRREAEKEGGRRPRPPTCRPTACGPGEARLLLSSSHVLRAATARRARGRGTIITLYKKCVFARSVGGLPSTTDPLHPLLEMREVVPVEDASSSRSGHGDRVVAASSRNS